MTAAGHRIGEVNVGGGLGAPARQHERAVDLDAYAAVLARHLGPLGVTIACEPGDALSKDAAILLGEVVTVEERRGVTFVGLDIGWNVNCSYFIYRFAQEIVVCRAPDAERSTVVTIAGHINEASDVFAEDYPMPPVEEGDMVALLNAGGYLQAMSSTHCLRPMGTARLPRSLRTARARTLGPMSKRSWVVLGAVWSSLRSFLARAWANWDASAAKPSGSSAVADASRPAATDPTPTSARLVRRRPRVPSSSSGPTRTPAPPSSDHAAARERAGTPRLRRIPAPGQRRPGDGRSASTPR